MKGSNKVYIFTDNENSEEKSILKSLIYFNTEVHYTDTTNNIIRKMLAEEIVF